VFCVITLIVHSLYAYIAGG